MKRSFTVLAIICFGAALSAHSEAFAIAVVPPTPSRWQELVGEDGKVTIGEGTAGGFVSYHVDAAPGTQVTAFAVSFKWFGEEFPEQAFVNSSGWFASVFPKDVWDEGQELSIRKTDDKLTMIPKSLLINSFETFFGTNDNAVVIYRRNATNSVIIADGSVNEFDFEEWSNNSPLFFRPGETPNSEFIAFGPNGEIIDGSFVAVATPEPSCFALAFMAMAGFGAVRRRRKRLC